MKNIEKLTLKDKINKDMTVGYSNILEKLFELAKIVIQITKQGHIIILNKDKFSVKNLISLYLIGALYAKEGEIRKDHFISVMELMDQLNISEGSFYARIKELRDNKKIKQVKKDKKTLYAISNNYIEKKLKGINSKFNN